MFNPALQKFYKSTNPNNANNRSTQTSLDISQVSTVAQILKDQKKEITGERLTVSKPVLFNIKKDTSIAVVFGNTDDLQQLNCVKSTLMQTKNQAGVFAQSEALYGNIDAETLNVRSVNIEDIDLSKISAEDAGLIFEGIIALSENNSFRKTKLPEQFQNFLNHKNNAHIKEELEANKLKLSN